MNGCYHQEMVWLDLFTPTYRPFKDPCACPAHDIINHANFYGVRIPQLRGRGRTPPRLRLRFSGQYVRDTVICGYSDTFLTGPPPVRKLTQPPLLRLLTMSAFECTPSSLSADVIFGSPPRGLGRPCQYGENGKGIPHLLT